MLKGKEIALRATRETDLDKLYDFHQNIRNRGPYFPIGVMPEPVFKRKFSENGFWGMRKGCS